MRRDGTAVQFNQIAHDRKSESETAMPTRGAGRALPEALEHMRQQVRGYSGAVVHDGNAQEALAPFHVE